MRFFQDGIFRTACGILLLRALLLPAQGAPLPSSSPSEAPFVQRESSWCIVAGGPASANAAVGDLADKLTAHLESVGFSAAHLAGRKLVVRLHPDAALASPRVYSGGETVLDMPAGFATARPREAARALAHAFCLRLANAAGRSGEPAPWLVTALGEEVMSSGNVSTIEASARLAAAEGPGEFAALSGASASDTATGRRRSFWLYRALRRDSGGRSAFIAEAMCGTSLTELRRRFFPVEQTPEAEALWWPVTFYRLTAERADALSGPAESAARHAELSRFVVEENGSDLPLDGPALVARRDRANLRRAVEERVLAFKIALPRVNPLWSNAYVARGLFLEKLADPKTDAATLARLDADAVAEERIARALSAESARLLSR